MRKSFIFLFILLISPVFVWSQNFSKEKKVVVGKYTVSYLSHGDVEVVEVVGFPYKASSTNNYINEENEYAFGQYTQYLSSPEVLTKINKKITESAPSLINKISDDGKNNVSLHINKEGGIYRVTMSLRQEAEKISPEDIVTITKVMSRLKLRAPSFYGYKNNVGYNYRFSMIKNKCHRTKFFVKADTINTDIVEYYKENNARWAYVANYPYKHSVLPHKETDYNTIANYEGYKKSVMTDILPLIFYKIRVIPSLFANIRKNNTGHILLNINRKGYATSVRFYISDCESCLCSEDIIKLTKIMEGLKYSKPNKYGLYNEISVDIPFMDIVKQ